MPEYLSKNLKVLQYDLILSQVSDERHLLQNKMSHSPPSIYSCHTNFTVSWRTVLYDLWIIIIIIIIYLFIYFLRSFGVWENLEVR